MTSVRSAPKGKPVRPGKRVQPAPPVPRTRLEWTSWTERNIAVALETVWLTAAVAVPLIVLSDHAFTDFTGLAKTASLRTLATLAAALMLLRLALKTWSWGLQGGAARVSLARLQSQAASAIRRPESRLVLLATLGLATVAISSMLSVAPGASLWGWVAGQDNFNLYNSASYFTLFLAVATTVRTRAQVWRLWAAIVAATLAAAAIGTAQYFGLSPFGISNTMVGRLTGPSGNPIFFGSFLVLGTPIALAACIALAQRRRHEWRWWSLYLACACALFLPLAWTIARGPWVGMLAVMPVLGAGVWFAAGKVSGLKTIAGLGVAVVAVAIFIIRPSVPLLDFSSAEITTVSASGQPQADGTTTQDSDRNYYYDSHVAGTEGVFSAMSRVELTRTSLELAATRPPIPDGHNQPWPVRFLFGYGPGTFQYAFQLVAPPLYLERLTASAHNDPANLLVEVGLAGLAVHVLLIISAVWFALSAVRGKGGMSAPHVRLLAVGVSAALAGRSAEQLFGIPQAGDSTIFWLVLGLLAALPRAIQQQQTAPLAPATRQARQQMPAFTRKTAVATLTVTACVVLAAWAVHLGWTRNIDYLRADAHVHQALQVARQDPQGALVLLSRGIDLAPDVARYYRMKSELIRSLAAVTIDPLHAHSLYSEAYELDLTALEVNPLWRDASFVAAYGAWELAKVGSPEYALEAIAHYERLARTAPAHALVQPRLEALRRAVKAAPEGPAGTQGAPSNAVNP